MVRARRRFFISMVVCGALLECADHTSAAIIAFDDFESYTNGDLTGKNGGTGWGGAYTANTAFDVVTGGLSYSSGAVNLSGGSQNVAMNFISGTTDNVLNRSFAAQTGTVYFSVLFRPVSGFTSDTDDFVQFLLNNDTSQNQSGSVVMRNGFFVRVRDTSDTSSTTTTPATESTYLLVGKISKNASANYNRMDLFLNPTTLTEPSATRTASNSTGMSSISLLTMRIAGLENLDRYDIDNFVVGTTYADVVSYSSIPEPSSIALTGLGLAAWATRRRLQCAKTSAV